MIIKIKNIRLRTIIGINDWEKKNKQELIINIEIEFDGKKASKTDNIDDTVNYKTINKKIIKFVEENNFNLIERVAGSIADVVLEDKKVIKTTVRVDKPGALRFTDSVSITELRERK